MTLIYIGFESASDKYIYSLIEIDFFGVVGGADSAIISEDYDTKNSPRPFFQDSVSWYGCIFSKLLLPNMHFS
jgi:hypothetical protein